MDARFNFKVEGDSHAVEVRSHDCVKAFCWVDELVGNAIDADGFLNFKVSWCFMVEACTFLSNPDVTVESGPHLIHRSVVMLACVGRAAMCE